MPLAAPIQSDFSGGEIGATVQGRVDFATYKKSVATLLNFIATLQGPVLRRPGTAFVAAAKYNNVDAKLIPFIFSNAQSYMLEFGNLYVRFFVQEAQLLQSSTITGITQANPAVVTSAAHGFINGMVVTISGVVGMTQINGTTALTANVTANTFELAGVNSTGYTAYSSGGTATAIYEIASPYLAADVNQLYTCQSADTLYIAHPKYPPYALVRQSTGFFTLTRIVFTDGPYLNQSIANTGLPVATTLTLSVAGPGAGITCTASAALFASTDVGRLIRIFVTTWGWCTITGFTDSTHVTVTVEVAAGGTAVGKVWRLGLWSDTQGWPACNVFHEGRLWWAGALGGAQRADSSNSSDYLNMTPTKADGTVLATHSVTADIASGDINQIVWMVSNQKGLQCGSLGAEFVVTPGATSDFIKPDSVFARRHSSYGSAAVKPITAGRSTIYVERAALKVREMAYAFSVDGFESEDLTILNPEVTLSGISQIAYTRTPIPIVWCLRADGMIAAVTYQRTQDGLRAAWHRHQMGGRSTVNGDPAVVKSIASIPTNTAFPAKGTQDELWLITQRSIGGVETRYVEFMLPHYEPTTFRLPVLANYLDCSSRLAEKYLIDNASVTNPATVTVSTSPTTFTLADVVVIDGVSGTTQLNGRVFLVSRVQGNVITLAGPSNTGPSLATISTITNFTKAVVTTISPHGFSNGDTVTFDDVLGMTQINGLTSVIEEVTDVTFKCTNINSSAFGVHSLGTGVTLDTVGLTPIDGAKFGAFLNGLPGTLKGALFPRISALNVGTYLNGETISAIADGSTRAGLVVASSSITLSPEVGFIAVGLPYKSDFQTLRYDAGAVNGTSCGKSQRIHRVGVLTREQTNLQIGFDFAHLQLLKLPSGSDIGSIGAELQSGWITAQPPNSSPDMDVRVCLRTNEALPATIMAITPMIETADRT